VHCSAKKGVTNGGTIVHGKRPRERATARIRMEQLFTARREKQGKKRIGETERGRSGER
jgi:hypothetical protein